MKCRLLCLPLLLAVAGCPITEPEEEGTTISAQFSTEFVETSTHQGTVTQNCSDTYTLAGTLTFVVREATGEVLDGTGRLTATQTWTSTTGTGCNRGPDRSTSGEWTADLGGTPGSATFIVERNSNQSFAMVTRFAFAGSVSATAASGTLTFTQTGSGLTGGTTQSTSNASASVAVSLH